MTYRVEGFTFGTEEEARLAGKEAEGIKYIRTQNNMSDPDTVLKLYNRLIEKEIFATPVGFAFLEELRRYLLTIPYIQSGDLLPLPGGMAAEEGMEEEKNVTHGRRRFDKERDYYRPFLLSTFIAIVFAAALLGIFIIMALSSDNVTILNYENQLIDRYERWEKDLLRRENELKEMEQQLEQRQQQQQQQQEEDTQWTN